MSRLPVAAVLLLLLFGAVLAQQTASITGTVSLKWSKIKTSSPSLSLIIRAYPLSYNAATRTVTQILIGALHRTTYERQIQIENISRETEKLSYQIDNLTLKGNYSIFAFVKSQDANGASKFEQFYQGMAGFYSASPCNWLQALNINATLVQNVNIAVTGKTNFFDTKPRSFGDIGSLVTTNGIATLKLKTTDPYKRGYAHGYIVAEQIMDFFRYYILQVDISERCSVYENEIAPKLMNRDMFHYSDEYLKEAQGILDGMNDSGADTFLWEFGRPFAMSEIFAINNYGALSFLISEQQDGSTATKEKPACSQYAFWGSQTQSSSLKGDLVASRNMDGEIDIRRVTVSHFLIFAVDPSPAGKKFVSFMWPGFIGTLSGINEAGVYVMDNFGSSNSNIIHRNNTCITTIRRSILMNLDAQQTTPENIEKYMHQFDSRTGGSCGEGCVMFVAKPVDTSSSSPPSFVYEGDYMSGFMRIPQQAEPRELQELIQATNHFHSYGVDPSTGPTVNFGKAVSFSSLWRYMASTERIRGLVHTSPQYSAINDISAVQQIMQTVAHGTTEHAIIYHADTKSSSTLQVKFWVSLAKQEDFTAWDAPYEPWILFNFEDFFDKTH